MKKQKLIILTVSLLLFIGIIHWHKNQEEKSLFGQEMIDQEKILEIVKGKECEDYRSTLMFNSEKIPYSESLGSYLLPQSAKDRYSGVITDQEGNKVYVVEPQKTKKELLTENQPIQFLIVKKNTYSVVYINLTLLPVMEIISDYVEDYNMDTFGTVSLLNPNGGGREGVHDVISEKCRFHIRGASSRLYDKKSYKLQLLNKKGDKKSQSLLGMRKDDDWVLNAMAFDPARMREKIGYELWNEISDTANHEMKYVELILDGQYMGIYGLLEPVDYKTYKADKEKDYLYSIISWETPEENRYLYREEQFAWQDGNYIMDEWRYEGKKNTEEAFMLLRDIIKNISEKQEEQMQIRFDLENAAEYDVFVNAILAMDNTYKNQKILCERNGKNSYTIRKSPWDLDYSMVNENTLKEFPNQRNAIFQDTCLPQTISDSLEYKKLLKEVYFDIRKEYYTEKNMERIVGEYQQLFFDSGVFLREQETWDNPLMMSSIESLPEFFDDRIQLLDKYYGGL